MLILFVIFVGTLIGVVGTLVGFTLPQVAFLAFIVCALIGYIELKSEKK